MIWNQGPANRLDELATGGVQQLFSTLHPLVAFSGDTLRITKYYAGRVHLNQRGLLLVPWPARTSAVRAPFPTLLDNSDRYAHKIMRIMIMRVTNASYAKEPT